jgi:Stage II sporulation protein E (SpoIIE)
MTTFRLKTALRARYAAATDPYWRALPMRSMRKLLASMFFTSGAVGFATDLLLLNYQSLSRGFFWPLFSGAIGSAAVAVRIKRIRLLPVLGLIMVAAYWLAVRVAFQSPALSDSAALKRRVVFDAIGILAGIFIGYRWLVAFISTDGPAAFRMQTELFLAHRIQATLVPTISFRTARFEVYGKSVPSTEMGGDLIDTIESDGSLLAYVADVSGHGLAAGQLMGMLKTAIRISRQLGQQPVATLESADRVLPAVKEPNMYATLALLCFDGSSEAEYALAGHLPILHYRAATGDTTQLSMEQFPLGLLPGGRYSSERVTYSAGDLFLMLTDGISEVPNAKDEDFGLARLEQLLVQNATRPLQQLSEFIMNEVTHHGPQQDDQTLLLLRVLL